MAVWRANLDKSRPAVCNDVAKLFARVCNDPSKFCRDLVDRRPFWAFKSANYTPEPGLSTGSIQICPIELFRIVFYVANFWSINIQIKYIWIFIANYRFPPYYAHSSPPLQFPDAAGTGAVNDAPDVGAVPLSPTLLNMEPIGGKL